MLVVLGMNYTKSGSSTVNQWFIIQIPYEWYFHYLNVLSVGIMLLQFYYVNNVTEYCVMSILETTILKLLVIVIRYARPTYSRERVLTNMND
jgi:hypothetical protein